MGSSCAPLGNQDPFKSFHEKMPWYYHLNAVYVFQVGLNEVYLVMVAEHGLGHRPSIHGKVFCRSEVE